MIIEYTKCFTITTYKDARVFGLAAAEVTSRLLKGLGVNTFIFSA